MSVVITNGAVESYSWLPGHFMSDFDAEETGIKKYVYTQDGDSATFVLNGSWPGGFLRVAIEAITGHAGMSDADILALLIAYVTFAPMDLTTYAKACLVAGVPSDRLREAMNNDGYVERLTRILDGTSYEDMYMAVTYPPAAVAVVQTDIDAMLGVIDDVADRFADDVADTLFGTAPSTITEGEVTTARTFI